VTNHPDSVTAFLAAACGPSGGLEHAERILAANAALARTDIRAAAVLGDAHAVRELLAVDPANATAKGGPYGCDALTYLCFSKYLRHDRARARTFLQAAEALLDAGADANTSYEPNGALGIDPEPAILGAAGYAHDPDLTRLLLDRGADPNNTSVLYDAAESLDNAAVKVLVASGRLTPLSFMTLLVRKLDWADYDGAAWVLANGADPNHVSVFGGRALHHALWRDSPLRFFELLLDRGADPTLSTSDGHSTFRLAARLGRGDVLQLLDHRGWTVVFEGDDAFLEACARGQETRARAIATADPAIVARLQSREPGLLADIAGAGHVPGVGLLLDLGFDVAQTTDRGTALHLAVWRHRRRVVHLLIERGAPLESIDDRGRTPLALAVRALVDLSEWTPHQSMAIVTTLLDAGAKVAAVTRFPTGRADVDELLRRHGREAVGLGTI
jgi:ankyrin repeat protein